MCTEVNACALLASKMPIYSSALAQKSCFTCIMCHVVVAHASIVQTANAILCKSKVFVPLCRIRLKVDFVLVQADEPGPRARMARVRRLDADDDQ